jgi:DNA-binding response OmpR family regulator
MRILVVEDDLRLRTNISTLLIRAYYAVDSAANGCEALEKGMGEDYDCILMDWMLPDLSGIEIVAELRKQAVKIPIIMLTARNMPHEVIKGLDVGADDYIAKPFDTKVLLARIRAVIRRKNQDVRNQELEAGPISLSSANREIRIDGAVMETTPKEFALLEYLLHYKNQTVSRVDLISHVWDENANLFSNTVDVYISHLRRKLAMFNQAHRLKTIKGMGYRLCDD